MNTPSEPLTNQMRKGKPKKPESGAGKDFQKLSILNVRLFGPAFMLNPDFVFVMVPKSSPSAAARRANFDFCLFIPRRANNNV